MKIDTCKMGDEFALTLPMEGVAGLGWENGDILEGQIEDGVLRIVRVKTKHDRAMEIAREVMEEYRETLEALAKS